MLDAIGVAAKCQAQFVLICGTGVMAARQGVLNDASLHQFSRLWLTFLNPCIVLQLSQYFTAAHVWAWSPILVACCGHVAIGAMLGRVGAWALKIQSPMAEALTMTCAFGNCGALPFVLVLPAVTNWKRAQADPGALEKGMCMIGLYLMAWFTLFFSVGVWYIDRLAVRQPLQSLDAATAGAADIPAAAPVGRAVAIRRLRCWLRGVDPMLGVRGRRGRAEGASGVEGGRRELAAALAP